MVKDTQLIDDLISEIGQTLDYPGDKIPPNLDKHQTAKVLDVTPGTLDVWACTGRHGLEYFKTGRHRRYRTKSVAKYIARSIHYPITAGG